MFKPKLIVLLGSTGSGKSELAVKLARKFNSEIISADSRQIYKEVDIGTGKVKGEWKKIEKLEIQKLRQRADKKIKAPEFFRGPADAKSLAGRRRKIQNLEFIYKGITHHLIDFLSPDKSYSVGEFKKDADRLIQDISKKLVYSHAELVSASRSRNKFGMTHGKKIPFLVGGTAQYIYSVVDNWQIPKIAADNKLRQNYESRIKNQEITIEDLYKELIKKDPGAKQFIQSNNPRRIIRALEVIELTGEKFSKIRQKKPPKYDSLLIGIKTTRDDLYKKIDLRVDQMIKDGLIDEVKKLVKKYDANVPGLQAIGYKELILLSGIAELSPGAGDNRRLDPEREQALDGASADLRRQILEETIQKIKFNTHRYIRHQNTWFKKDKRIKWIKNYKQAELLIEKFLEISKKTEL